jgi:hypothetical protein
MSYTHRTLIIPADIAPACQQLTLALSGESGAEMFTTGLSATGAEPATHFISSGMIYYEFAAMLADAQVMFGACQTAGLSTTLSECESILSAADVSDDEPFVAMARMGLLMLETEAGL